MSSGAGAKAWKWKRPKTRSPPPNAFGTRWIFCREYVLSQSYDLKFALEAKPNEPRGDIYLPTTGAMLGFIATLAHPEMVGVNPEFAHETMAGLSFLSCRRAGIGSGQAVSH